jgi:hypothetical protein
MALTYATNAANARLTAALLAAVAGQSVDGNSTFGQLVIGTSAMSITPGGPIGTTGVLATLTLQKPSHSIAAKVATLLGVPLSVAASGAGTAALANFCDSAGTIIVANLTVGTTGANINLSSVAFGVGEAISINSGTLTHP